jgi:ribose transport system ATP-binding protein
MTLLAIQNASKTYAGVAALRNVSLSIAPGEIHALMGENGAGKSTLIQILAGAVRADQVTIAIDSRPVAIDHPDDAFRHGLRFIHQELNVVPTLSVAENIFVGRAYPKRFGGFVDWRRLTRAAGGALARLGLTHIDPHRKLARLSFGDRMLVRIAAAFLEGTAPALLYVMDEPTAALTTGEAERLFAVLREIRRSGGSVLYVSHRLDEVMRLCDRVTVLRDGAVVATSPIAETSEDEIIRMMIGREVGEAHPPQPTAVGDEIVLEANELAGPGVDRITLSLKKGEIVGLAGLAGAGQSELLNLLIGAERRKGGVVRLAGRNFSRASPAAAWAAGLAYVPRERRAEGLFLSRAISENITLPHLGGLSRGGIFLARRRERAFTMAHAAGVGLRARGPHQRCRELSGGNQQKVLFARALAGRPKVLLLDEPTRGVDVAAKFDIYGIIRELKRAGTAVLIASSDAPELIALSDRILVMRDGVVTTALAASGLSEEALLAHCHGRPPAAKNSAMVSASGA